MTISMDSEGRVFKTCSASPHIIRLTGNTLPPERLFLIKRMGESNLGIARTPCRKCLINRLIFRNFYLIRKGLANFLKNKKQYTVSEFHAKKVSALLFNKENKNDFF